MIIGVPKETRVGEKRVALIPAHLGPLKKSSDLTIWVEAGAGLAAGYPDSLYEQAGAVLVSDRHKLLAESDVLLQVHVLGSGSEESAASSEVEHLHTGQTLIGMCDPLWRPRPIQTLAHRGVLVYAMELIPRISRAQSMDVLSSMATISGYKAVLLAANELPRMFPLLMTAAGTVTPAKVLVIGAGVAGLQAIAQSRKLGAVVTAYDVRPTVRDQIESLGAKFLEIELETGKTEGEGGYARAMDETFYRKQRELLSKAVEDSDVVISTAALPGAKSPVLITREMVGLMKPGAVIIDLAAERGGNCELTRPDQATEHNGVWILGPTNLPSTVPYHASQMYSKNLLTFVQHLAKCGFSRENADEICRETLVAGGGEVLHPKLRSALGLEPRTVEQTPSPATS